MERADGSPLAGAQTIAVETRGIEATSRRATLQVASPDGSISPPRSPRPSAAGAVAGRGLSPSPSGSFLPTLLSPKVVEHRASVDARLSSGEAVHRRQRESTDFRIRNLRSRSLSPERRGTRGVSPQGRLAAEVARRAAQDALNREPSVALTGDERATQAAIKRLADETVAMELASEAMKQRLAVEAEIIKAKAAPKVYAVSSAHFNARVAALQAERLGEHDLPEALRTDDARFSWPRRSPQPQADCTEAIDRAERSVRLHQWRSQLLGTPPRPDSREEALATALAAIPAALQRRDPRPQRPAAAAAAAAAAVASAGGGGGGGGGGDAAVRIAAERDYTSMDWLDTLGRARLRSPRRRGRRSPRRQDQSRGNAAGPSAIEAALAAVRVSPQAQR
jgi:hypothetical protein